MNAKNLLDQLLSSGQSMLSETLGSRADTGAPARPGYANFGTGMLAGGVLGLLLGDKRVRKFGGKALSYGGAAALGALAFRAYSDWQRQKSTAGAPGAEPAQFLPAPAEDHSRAVLKALIAAAKSDGHIDARERGLIEDKLAALAGDPALRSWIDAEVARPLDPADVAAAAGSMEVASEMYLVSVLAVDTESFMERAYLDALATQLTLPAELKAQLETEAKRALAAA